MCGRVKVYKQLLIKYNYYMSDTLKTELISAGNTFFATILTVVATTVSGGVEWTSAFWVALALTAIRTATRAVINSFVPTRLGGRK